MKVIFACTLLLALGMGGHAAKVSPVQKVIELLDNLKGKVAADLAAEEAEMVEYSKYCDDEISERGYAIRTSTKAIERLTADIENGNAQVSAAEDEIASLSSHIAKKETELATSVDQRKAERGDFKKTEAALVKADDELHSAENILKREMNAFVQTGKDGKKVASPKSKMSQKSVKAITEALSKVIDSASTTSKSRAKLQGFLQAAQQSGTDDKALQMPASEAPSVDAYEGHSGGIVETVKDLEVKDEDQLASTRKGEMEDSHAFDMMKMSMEDAIDLLKKKVGDETTKKNKLAESAAAAAGEKAETEKTKAADEKFKATLERDCKDTAAAWEERKASAAEEQAAIEKAKEILATGVKALLQVGGASKRKGDDDVFPIDNQKEQRAKLQSVLKNLGHKFNSYAMMEIASAAGQDPFGKVKTLIEDMISKLLEEAAQEADHKAFCDEELGKSRKAKDEKARKMDQYRTRMDEASTTKATLQTAVGELQAEVSEMDAAQAEATKIRSEEHDTYLQASSDYKASAEAVEKAMGVLSEYYGKSFVQVKQAKGKQPAFGSKTGGDAASTILGIMEVAASDFTRLLAETEANEAEAAATYKKLVDDNAVAKSSKLAEEKAKMSEMKSLTVALAHHSEDYKSTDKEYGAVLDYLDKLKPECETKVMSYEEKKQRRESEIEGLKEGLAIIEGSAIPSVELIQRH